MAAVAGPQSSKGLMEVKSEAEDMQLDKPVTEEGEGDLYTRLKILQRQIEFFDIQVPYPAGSYETGQQGVLLSRTSDRFFLCMQEEYIKEEQRNLKRELLRAQEEVKRIQSVPLVIGQFLEMVDNNNGIVGSTTGSNYYVRYLHPDPNLCRMADRCTG